MSNKDHLSSAHGSPLEKICSVNSAARNIKITWKCLLVLLTEKDTPKYSVVSTSAPSIIYNENILTPLLKEKTK